MKVRKRERPPSQAIKTALGWFFGVYRHREMTTETVTTNRGEPGRLPRIGGLTICYRKAPYKKLPRCTAKADHPAGSRHME